MTVSVHEPKGEAPISLPRAAGHTDRAAITVLIADDHALFREALRGLLDDHPDFQVVGDAGDGREAVRLARMLRPDVLLLDLHMPVMAGLEALEEISRLEPPVRTLIVASAASEEEVADALQSGARGIVMKNAAIELLFKSIRMVAAGQYWVGRECVGDLIHQIRQRQAGGEATAPSYGLTPRELQLVAGVVSGCGNSEIAQQLQISAKTVKHHLTNIFNKLGVSNRLELALFALHHRIRVGRFS
jgi:two-component system, NarL family, nitrate/nitrite response regulator NarL